MALQDRDIIITPNRGQSTEPLITFRGADSSSSATITLRVLNSGTVGTLSFEGNAGQLFSLSDDLSGSIFSVNDVSGIPSVEVFDTGEIRLAEYNGYVHIAGSTAATSTNSGVLQVVGGVGVGGDLYVGGTIYASISGVVSGTSTNSDNIKTVSIATNANHNLTFVNSNNGTAAYEALYTDAEIVYNPSTNSLGIGITSPSGTLHARAPAITAAAPSLGWPVYNAETDTNSKSFYFDTAGNGSTTTAGYGATVSLLLGQYYDSRVIWCNSQFIIRAILR